MHLSEAHLDTPQKLRRVRVPGFNDSAVGVAFVDGEAQSGVPSIVVARMRAIGFTVEDLGPWGEYQSDEPTTAVTPVVVVGSPPVVEKHTDDAGDELTEKHADDAGDRDDARPRRRGIR